MATAAVLILEYLAAEVLELAAIREKATVVGGGDIPHIHPQVFRREEE